MTTSPHPSAGPGAHEAAPASPVRPVRIALVGYGGAGGQIHSPLIREAGLQVTAVVVRDPGRRRKAEDDWPGVRIEDDIAGLLAAAGNIDAVVVASPTGLHAEHVRGIINAGLPCIVDKPLALTAGTAAELVGEAKASSVPLTVFQNRRWDGEQLTLASLLRRGELGRVHTFERHWERWRPVPKNRWKENDLSAGGLLLDLGPHLVDSAVQLFGPVKSVWGQARALTTATEDDVFLVLNHGKGPYGDGVLSRLWAGSLVAAAGPRTRVLGSKGAYLVTSYENDESPFDICDDGAPDGAEGWLTWGGRRRAVPRAYGSHADFYRAVPPWLAGGPAPVDPWDAVRTACVLDAARLSIRDGIPVRVDYGSASTGQVSRG